MFDEPLVYLSFYLSGFFSRAILWRIGVLFPSRRRQRREIRKMLGEVENNFVYIYEMVRERCASKVKAFNVLVSLPPIVFYACLLRSFNPHSDHFLVGASLPLFCVHNFGVLFRRFVLFSYTFLWDRDLWSVGWPSDLSSMKLNFTSIRPQAYSPPWIVPVFSTSRAPRLRCAPVASKCPR